MAFDIGKLDLILSKLFEQKNVKEEEEKEEEEISINFTSEQEDTKYTNSASTISNEISILYDQLQEAESQSQRDAILSAIDQKKEEYENKEIEHNIKEYIEDADLPQSESKELSELYESLINADGVLQKNIIQEKIEKISEELGLSNEETDKLESFDAET